MAVADVATVRCEGAAPRARLNRAADLRSRESPTPPLIQNGPTEVKPTSGCRIVLYAEDEIHSSTSGSGSDAWSASSRCAETPNSGAPLGGVEALYGYVTEGHMICSLGVSNFYILGAVLVMTVLVRRAFCGYMCPVGTTSEWIHAAAKRFRLPTFEITGLVDRALAMLKYPVLAAILFFTWHAGKGLCGFMVMGTARPVHVTRWFVGCVGRVAWFFNVVFSMHIAL